MKLWLAVVASIAGAVTVGGDSAPARSASFPGDASEPRARGRIVYTRELSSGLCCMIVTVESDGTGRRAIGVGAEPAWSPDGRRIAFQNGDHVGVWTMTADGANRRRLTADAGDPAWSPRGDMIAIAAGYPEGGDADLVVVAAAGGGRRKLTDGAGVSAPAWSPDGTRIAYVSGGDVWTIAADGSDERLVVRNAGAPSWRPDGRMLAFSRDGATYVVGSDGSNERRLRDGYGAAWSPDGRWLAFTTESALCVADAQGRNARGLAFEYDASSAGWNPDGDPPVKLPPYACDDPKPRFASWVTRPERRRVAPARRATFLATRRNVGSDPGYTEIDVFGVRNGRLLTWQTIDAPCARRGAPPPDSATRALVYPGGCVQVRVTVRTDEPGRVRLLMYRGGRARVVASAVVAGCTALGTARRDVLIGTPGPDRVCGDADNDLVRGGAGDDVLWGGEGIDRLTGGPGRDRLEGGSNLDALLGGSGDDVLHGGSGRDRLFGGVGDDVLRGEHGYRHPESNDEDHLHGGPGDDLLDGGRASDTLDAGPGNDVVLARDGNGDAIDCGPGRDRAYVDRTVYSFRPETTRGCEFVQRG